MGASAQPLGNTEREWRRRVQVRARIKCPSGWNDASILNVSSRGLLIHSPHCAAPGSRVELRGGDQVINATVVWRRGQRAGLQSACVLPVLDIMSLTDRPEAASAIDDRGVPLVCRRRQTRPPEAVLAWPRLLEQSMAIIFAIAIIAALAVACFGLITPSYAQLMGALR